MYISIYSSGQKLVILKRWLMVLHNKLMKENVCFIVRQLTLLLFMAIVQTFFMSCDQCLISFSACW